jgi:hypothetical protein
MIRRKTIAVDFDGTIVVEEYPCIGPEISGAIESIKEIQSLGFNTVLWTCRSGKPLEEAVLWLSERGVEFTEVNKNIEAEIEFWDADPRKVAADVYIDDRVIGGFVGWTTVMEEIRSLSPDVAAI